jgi:peptidylprolyl isomerase
MSNPVTGSTVAIHYTVRLADGQIVETTTDKDPIEVTLGANQIMPGVERALMDMSQGGKSTVTIPADSAYGPHDANLVQRMERSALPEDISDKLQAGMTLKSTSPQGQDLQLTVVELSAESVTFDANHPLAGRDLTFDLELVKVG